MTDARSAAAAILYKIEVNNAYSALSVSDELNRDNFIDKRDRAFVSSLVYGVLEHKLTIDYNLSLYLSQPVRKLHPTVLAALRVACVQLFFMNKIPSSAAVNEAVKYVKKNRCAYASGLVNAVLRKASSNGLRYPEASSREEFLSIRYSFPTELVRHYINAYGEEKAERIIASSEGRRPVYIRVNNLLTDEKELTALLEKEGVSVKNTTLPGCLEIEYTGDVSALEAFGKGYFHVQDMSSQLCCLLLGAREGDTVADCCAAPGGKSFTAAEMMNGKGKIYACDLYEHRTQLIAQGAERLGIKILETVCGDARELPGKIASADRVLCDVPCSGLGVIGRKPEIRYKSFSSFEELPTTQYDILDRCSDMVRPGGRLLYSTCTLNPAENEEVCERFLASHPVFSVVSDELTAKYSDGEKYVNFIPDNNGGDGFFVALFERGRNE